MTKRARNAGSEPVVPELRRGAGRSHAGYELGASL
jgi:hypothetical protein